MQQWMEIDETCYKKNRIQWKLTEIVTCVPNCKLQRCIWTEKLCNQIIDQCRYISSVNKSHTNQIMSVACFSLYCKHNWRFRFSKVWNISSLNLISNHWPCPGLWKIPSQPLWHCYDVTENYSIYLLYWNTLEKKACTRFLAVRTNKWTEPNLKPNTHQLLILFIFVSVLLLLFSSVNCSDRGWVLYPLLQHCCS